MFAFNFFFIFAPGHNLLALELRKGKSVIPSIFLHVFQVTKKIMVLIFAGDYLMHGKGSSLCFKKEIILVQFLGGFLEPTSFCAKWHQQHWLIMCQYIFKPGFSALKGLLCLFASSSNVFNVLKLSSMWKILIEFPVNRKRTWGYSLGVNDSGWTMNNLENKLLLLLSFGGFLEITHVNCTLPVMSANAIQCSGVSKSSRIFSNGFYPCWIFFSPETSP